MTEAEYEKLVNRDAEDYASLTNFSYATAWDEIETIFKAAVKWARENPPPEVQALAEALESAACFSKGGTPHFKSDNCVRCNALARFKERTAGKGEE